MSRFPFGFRCGDFSIVLSGNDFVLPGSKNQPLRRSLLPLAELEDAAGLYTLQVTVEGRAVCHMPVRVAWVEHKSQPEPFLGFAGEDSKELRAALAAYIGKAVDLEFKPR